MRTQVIASLTAEPLATLAGRVSSAANAGADVLELRIDGWAEDAEPLRRVIGEYREIPWIITCRSVDEGGSDQRSPVDRAMLIADIVAATGAIPDFEFQHWRKSSASRDVLARAIETGGGPKSVILSAHDFQRCPDRPRDIVAEILGDASASGLVPVAKLAYLPREISESFAALDIMREFGARASVVAMGEDGMWTRVIAQKLGAFGTYASLDAESATAPGQVSLSDLKHLYRFGKLGPKSGVFGVAADPVAHSLSPLLHNAWFESEGFDAVYLPLRVRGGADQFGEFVRGCASRPWLGVGGLSVTTPHKAAAANLREARVDGEAEAIGAANTVCFAGGRVRVYNTDCHACIDSLLAAMGRSRCDALDVPIDVIGAGGAARAFIYGARELGAHITVYARRRSAAAALAEEFGVEVGEWDRRGERTGEVLVNTSVVGLAPEVEVSPMPAESLAGVRLAFDLIYNPLETKLLRDAQAVGASALNGLDMFVRQAAMQFELWTGTRPDINLGLRTVAAALAGDEVEAKS